MRILFFAFFAFLFLNSCSKKKQVLTHSTETFSDGTSIRTEVYLDHDSAFSAYYFVPSGRIFILKKAIGIEELKDSTFSKTVFYENGKLRESGQYEKKMRVGIWKKYYESGNIESETHYLKGKISEVVTWWANGNKNTERKILSDGKISSKEFFENGNPAQELLLDTIGNGTCVNYHYNGKRVSYGDVYHENPVGIWKRFDTLGQSLKDTLFGINEISR